MLFMIRTRCMVLLLLGYDRDAAGGTWIKYGNGLCAVHTQNPVNESNRDIRPTIAMAVSRPAAPQESARSADAFQHTAPSFAIPDLEPVAFQFEGTRLVSIGEFRRQAALDVMGDHAFLCVYGVSAEVGDIGGVSGEGMLG